ncbi:MAG: DUF5674 family protein [bacterium]|nr:DUF5674 family protein [bacterium]
MIHLIQNRATSQQINEMLESLETYIKLAVDIQMGILAGGGELHADCEEVLLNNGSNQENIWGADWYPKTKKVFFESFINIRPRDNNRSMLIQDPLTRNLVEKTVREFLEIE